MANLAFLGAFSSYVPQATGQVISFMRDPKKFKLNAYSQYVQSEKEVGVYYRIGVDQPVRVVNDNLNIWADGFKRPESKDNQLKFDLVEFQTVRRNWDYTLGWKYIKQADADVLVLHSAMAQSQCMTSRTNRAMTLLQNSANWGNNTSTAAGLNGGAGYFDQASDDPNNPNYLAIKKTFDTTAQRIMLLTNGMVDVEEKGVLKWIMSPNVAQKISQSAEIHDYLKHSPAAMDQVKGRVPGQNAKWGLPDELYGWDIVVETAMIVTQNPSTNDAIGSEASIGSNGKRTWIKDDNSIVAVSRVGGLDGQYGAPSFSTVQIYYVGKEIEMETFDEPNHRRTIGAVVEDVKVVLAAPASGYLVTSVLSPAASQ